MIEHHQDLHLEDQRIRAGNDHIPAVDTKVITITGVVITGGVTVKMTTTDTSMTIDTEVHSVIANDFFCIST